MSGSVLNYLLAALTILLGIILAFLARRAVRWLESKAGETSTLWDDILIAAIGTPVQVSIIVISAYFAIIWFGILPESMQWILNPAYATAFWILISA